MDKIFDMIGVEHVERQYKNEEALCCGSTIMPQKRPDSRRFCLDIQRQNIEDVKHAGAELCIFNCPACMQTLWKQITEYGIMPIWMSDLCRMAIGEKPA